MKILTLLMIMLIIPNVGFSQTKSNLLITLDGKEITYRKDLPCSDLSKLGISISNNDNTTTKIELKLSRGKKVIEKTEFTFTGATEYDSKLKSAMDLLASKYKSAGYKTIAVSTYGGEKSSDKSSDAWYSISISAK